MRDAREGGRRGKAACARDGDLAASTLPGLSPLATVRWCAAEAYGGLISLFGGDIRFETVVGLLIWSLTWLNEIILRSCLSQPLSVSDVS